MTFNAGGGDSAAERAAEAMRVEALRGELVRLLEGRTGSDGRHETAIPELKLYRFSDPTEPAHVLQEPAVYVVVQGRKQVTVGDETYVYDPSQYLAVSVELPAVGHVVEASPEEPYLCMTLAVDPRACHRVGNTSDGGALRRHYDIAKDSSNGRRAPVRRGLP